MNFPCMEIFSITNLKDPRYVLRISLRDPYRRVSFFYYALECSRETKSVLLFHQQGIVLFRQWILSTYIIEKTPCLSMQSTLISERITCESLPLNNFL